MELIISCDWCSQTHKWHSALSFTISAVSRIRSLTRAACRLSLRSILVPPKKAWFPVLGPEFDCIDLKKGASYAANWSDEHLMIQDIGALATAYLPGRARFP
jgi:hypothetical protein